MKSHPDRLLQELPDALSPSFSLDLVTTWVRAGRRRRNFHALAWLSRVLRFPHS